MRFMGMMRPCEGCRRHLRAAEERCPFCAAPRSRVVEGAKRAAAVVASLAVGATLAACYGRPVSHDNLDRQPIGDAAGDAQAAPTASASTAPSSSAPPALSASAAKSAAPAPSSPPKKP